MKDLLDRVVSAHGGIDRWNQINRIKVKASITGGIWYVKGKPDALKDVIIDRWNQINRINVRDQHTFWFED